MGHFEFEQYETIRQATRFGEFRFFVWPGDQGKEPVAYVTPQLDTSRPVLVRIHSECLYGDTFLYRGCDCGEQKEVALRMIADSGNGLFLYHRQEGRGIGLFEKTKALRLQQQSGCDTYEANVLLGHPPDARTYDDAGTILKGFGISRIHLLTNNPGKIAALQKEGIRVEKRVPLTVKASRDNRAYLSAKKYRFGHSVEL